jgi:hypothetical protein
MSDMIEHESDLMNCVREGPHLLTECGYWLGTIDGRLYQLGQAGKELIQAIRNALQR